MGNLGRAYKERNPASRYYGVELHPPSAEIAATKLDKVFTGAVEDIDLSSLEGTVDCIVYGDVLEHLVDPWASLRANLKLLKPDGKIAACIPNVQHWSLLQHVLKGYWVYSEHGLLDRTHLRFFTLHSIMTMFADTGYQVESAFGLNVDQEGAADFVEQMRTALNNLGIDPAEFLEHCSVMQYLVVATPAARA